MSDQQMREWNSHVAAEHRQGRCEHSGYTFTKCAASICDCGMEWWDKDTVREYEAKARAGETACPAHGPLTDGGGCAGCVAEDRATDAWEGRR